MMLAGIAIAFACLAPTFHDGDNIRCAGTKSMRIAGIDAPEFTDSPKCRPRPQPWAACDDRLATRSRDHLRRLGESAPVTCRVHDPARPRDRYDRLLVDCAAGGRDLGQAQIAAGMARVWE